jgi:lysyl endopeptidase
LALFHGQVSGQVFKRVIRGEGLERIIPYHIPKEDNPILRLPQLYIDSVLQQDVQNGNTKYRFGVGHRLNFTKSDGAVSQISSYTIWKMGFESEGATSLNFQFDNFNLPEGSMAFIYDNDENVVIGPIEPINIFEKTFSTALIPHDNAIVKILVPSKLYDEFSVQITSITHGFRGAQVGDRGYGDSGACQLDVNCSSVAWSPSQRDATVNIFVPDGNGDVTLQCSGVLLNNSCRDGKAYCLTAAHCYIPPLNSFVFECNYDSPDPVAPVCRGSEPSVTIFFSGANYRAKSDINADFFLVELNSNLMGFTSIALAGWDRSFTTPSLPVRYIHHPAGDVKKITTSISTATIPGTGGTPTITATTPPGLLIPFWSIPFNGWASGSTIGGSSGAPLFNSAGRVVGQHFGRSGYTTECPPSGIYHVGRLSTSWTGDGTNGTRLSNWLGSGSTTENSMTLPYISGSGPLCGITPKNFTLVNILPSRTATWTVSPANLVLVASGSGTTASIRAATANSSGLVTLTFLMSPPSGSSCTGVSITRKIWIGKPANYSISGPSIYCPGQTGTIILNGDILSTQNASVTWSFNGALSSLYGYDMSAQAQASYSIGGNGIITANVQNACGITSPTLFFQIVSCGQGGNNALKVSPNPSDGMIDIRILKAISDDEFEKSTTYRIFDPNGTLMMQGKASGQIFQIDVSSLKNNVYLLEVQTSKSVSREKILIIH